MATLYYGDNLDVMRKHLEKESVDLIYLDPPASAGFYTGANAKLYPRLQILDIEGLLSGKLRADHPNQMPDLNFKKAKREVKKTGQEGLF